MPAQAPIQLAVCSDDFGLHPAINEGIIETFEQGLLTDTNLMAPCPGFEDAIRLSRSHAIPIGLHATFSCDMVGYPWGPLTALRSMTTAQGHFRETVEASWKEADLGEAAAELRAQYQRCVEAGIPLTHLSFHMGLDSGGRLAGLIQDAVRWSGVPYRGCTPSFQVDGQTRPWGVRRMRVDLQIRSSRQGLDLPTRKEYLKRRLFSLPPGHHMWVVHPAADHPSLDPLLPPNHPLEPWARRYRALDRAVLLDGEVREWIEELGIRLIPMSKLPLLED